MLLSRRTMLRASGVALGLPFLDAMLPRAHASGRTPKRRFVAVNLGLGLHAPNFVPAAAGRDYPLSPYLEILKEFRNEFTVISGSSHPNVDGGHFSDKSFLTTAPHPAGAGFKNTISLDQVLAQKIGLETRFGFLALSTGGFGLSWTRSGVQIPTETRPSQAFARLFLEGKPEQKKAQVQRLNEGRSVLDVTMEQLRQLRGRVGTGDGARLDDFAEAVREAEQRLQKAKEWEDRPKPKVDAKPPGDVKDRGDVTGRARLMYDVMHLALRTDSTRLITFFESGANAVPPIPGVSQDYHNLSHHGQDPAKIKELGVVESDQMKAFGEFLAKLKGSAEGEGSLLDQTAVLFGSNLGNASSHDSRNMPILLAGGGFRHGRHLAFDQEKNYPLGNLFVSLLQRFGIEADSFGNATGTMRGLEPL
jgi:hypothetical protein